METSAVGSADNIGHDRQGEGDGEGERNGLGSVDHDRDGLLQHGINEVEQSRVLSAEQVVVALLFEPSSEQHCVCSFSAQHKPNVTCWIRE